MARPLQSKFINRTVLSLPMIPIVLGQVVLYQQPTSSLFPANKKLARKNLAESLRTMEDLVM